MDADHLMIRGGCWYCFETDRGAVPSTAIQSANVPSVGRAAEAFAT
jgi:hypothetical protein